MKTINSMTPMGSVFQFLICTISTANDHTGEEHQKVKLGNWNQPTATDTNVVNVDTAKLDTTAHSWNHMCDPLFHRLVS